MYFTRVDIWTEAIIHANTCGRAQRREQIQANAFWSPGFATYQEAKNYGYNKGAKVVRGGKCCIG